MNKLKYTEAEAVPCGGGYCPLCRALEHTCNSEDKDTRKQLETDMREWWRVGLPGIQEKAENVINYNEAIKWLDRQAAITEREWIDTECEKCGAREIERDRDFTELQAQVDELTAERDNLKTDNDKLCTLIGVQTRTIDKLADERYRYKLQCEQYEARINELNSQAERTCRSTTDDSAWCFVCSECGKSFPRSKLHLAHNHGEINYCPNCGCKKVSE